MDALIYFALWLGMVYLISRMDCHVQETGRGGSAIGAGIHSDPKPQTNLLWVAPDKDIDPVCKKTVITETAKSCVHAGAVYYFCSRDCREIFEAAPDLYVGSSAPKTLEHAHV